MVDRTNRGCFAKGHGGNPGGQELAGLDYFVAFVRALRARGCVVDYLGHLSSLFLPPPLRAACL